MSLRGGSTRRSFLGVVSALFFVGCLSPTLPLPPPGRPQISSPDEMGMVRVSGTVRSRATALVLNSRTDRIAGQKTDTSGKYDIEIEAQVRDRLVIWYEVGDETSQIVEVYVPGPDESADADSTPVSEEDDKAAGGAAP